MPPSKAQLYSENLLGEKYKNAGLLIAKIRELHENLSTLSQESDRPKSLSTIASQLIHTKILHHRDKDVRLLACCCVVDILRIFAPEVFFMYRLEESSSPTYGTIITNHTLFVQAPYSDKAMVGVFDALISQLRGLSNYDSENALSSKIMYILNSLASVKSCVVPVILATNKVAGMQEVVVSMFEALLSSVRPDHSQDIISKK